METVTLPMCLLIGTESQSVGSHSLHHCVSVCLLSTKILHDILGGHCHHVSLPQLLSKVVSHLHCIKSTVNDIYHS